MLCTVDWMNERQEPLSNKNIERLFGAQIRRTFNFYREIAIAWKHLTPSGTTLTPAGQRIVTNWRRMEAAIFDL